MSFFTSLTGLNAATTQLSVTSNNIANAGTTGFKRSRSDFGDIFATSPLQKASTVVGQGTALKQVTQEFSQGNIELSGNSLDLAVTGEGFFPLRSADGQDLFTRNGSFLLDEQNTVVNSAGQFLKVASVDSLGKADFKADLIPLTIAPRTVGEAVATSNIDFAINFPAESPVLTTVDENNLEQIKPFNPNDPSTYAKSAAITIFDENGNDFLLTFFYRRVQVASAQAPENKWQTHVVLDGKEITPALGQATTSDGRALFVDKYGNTVPEDELPVVLNDNLVFQKYNQDDLSTPSVSVPATVRSGLVEKPYLSDEAGVNFSSTPATLTLDNNLAEPSTVPAGSSLAFTLTDENSDAVSISTTSPSSTSFSLTNLEDSDVTDVFELVLTTDETPAVATTLNVPLVDPNDAASGMNPSDLIAALNTQGNAAGFSFALAPGFEGATRADVLSRIQVTRADGTNFSMAAGANMALTGGALVRENITSTHELLTQTPTAKTSNGSTLALDATMSDIADALNASAIRQNLDYSVSVDSRGDLVISRGDGSDFSAEVVGAVPVAGMLQGPVTLVAGDEPTATDLATGVVLDQTTDGVNAPDFTHPDHSGAFKLTVDEDPNDVNATQAIEVDLSVLSDPANQNLSGDRVASILTTEINRQFGDQRYFNLSNDANRQFRMTFDASPNDEDNSSVQVVDVVLPAGTSYTENEVADLIQAQLHEATNTAVTVEYNRANKGFTILPENPTTEVTISNVPASASITGAAVPNTLFGLPTLSSNFTLSARGTYAAEVLPNGEERLPQTAGQQRYGLKVEFIPNTEEGGTGGRFTISSGTTGDTSAIRIEEISENARDFFGFDVDDPSAVLEVSAAEGTVAERGVESTAAKVFGKPVSFDPEDTIPLDELNNEFTVTVDNVTETFRLPPGNYNLNSFKLALQDRINAMEDSRGNAISGVVVDFNQDLEIFSFQSGTTGDSSFFQISGPSQFGLSGLESSVGQTQTFRTPVAEQTANARPVYVTKDENGVFREYSNDPTSGLDPLPGSREFTTDPEFRPLFLDKGELTFDTAGNLISPLDGISLDNVVIGGSGNTLNIGIDYAGSTQFSGDFSVNSQSQNGQANGSLVAVDIADDGLVTASYSNGTQDLKGKIVLATFSTPNGLRQLGDSTFLESNESWVAQLGEPGGAGFGTIRAGARERANVDLTSELVDLITAQRNFQANAKAIETSSTLTSTIINIRS